MNDFEELDIPKKALNGWYVVSMVHGVRYLHDDSRLHVGTQDLHTITSGYFPTENDALILSKRYYKYHCMPYPYKIPTQGSQNVNDGSQQMNFGQ